MNALDCEELHFLLDNRGAIIAFQEKEQSWAGALAFSSEELARKFAELSHLDVAEIAAIACDDHGSVAALITALKLRPIRYLLLDLDKGMQLKQARQSSVIVLVVSLALTLIIGARLW